MHFLKRNQDVAVASFSFRISSNMATDKEHPLRLRFERTRDGKFCGNAKPLKNQLL